jgi:hypothetical protein
MTYTLSTTNDGHNRLGGRIRAALVSGEHATELARIAELGPRLLPGCDAAELAIVKHAQLLIVARSTGAPVRNAVPADDLDSALGRLHTAPRAVLRGFASSVWLPLQTSDETGLLLHSRSSEGVTDADPRVLDLVTGLGSSLATKLALSDEVENLRSALASNRRIGIAMGIIVERLRITPDEAFEVLRRISQTMRTKLRDVAEDIIMTGDLGGLPFRDERDKDGSRNR